MSKTRRGPQNRNLPAFSAWLKRWLDAEARREGVSLRKLMESRGSNRANLNRWQNLTEDMSGPTRETVDREFDSLGISEEDRAEPYGYLGWTAATVGERMTSLEAKMKRAEAFLRLDITPAQREEYERGLADARAVYEMLLDRVIAQAEANLARSHEGDGPTRG